MNALPSEVKAYINHRVHPNDSFESILNMIGKQTEAQSDDNQLLDLICNHALILHSLQNTGK
jgi:acetylornithine deacetylase/succinyl-diaminopimelate desuccinylase-like protein